LSHSALRVHLLTIKDNMQRAVRHLDV